MSKGGKSAGSPGSAALVSDIGIVKKGGSKGATSGGNSSSNNDPNANSPGLVLEDSFEKYYNKDLDLEEDQVPVVIYELNESAINFISQEQYEKALILLQKAQTMLDQIQADKIPCDQFIFLLTLHNMAMCYQKLGILEECSICLEACIDHLDSDHLQKYFNNPEQPSLRLKMLKYKCKTHMQICALLSQIHKHKEAVFHSNKAIKISHYLINECKNQCEFYVEQLTTRGSGEQDQKKKQNDISIIGDKRYSLLEKTAVKMLPILIEIQKKMAIEDYRLPKEGGVVITGPIKLAKGGRGQVSPNRRGNVAPPGAGQGGRHHADPLNTYSSNHLPPGSYDCGNSDMKNILGYLNQSEWVYSLNIGNIMQISPLTLQDFLSHTAIQLELSREFVLEKMCFLAVSYFCMGTEYRFLHQLKEKISEQTFERRDSEYWHGKAVETAISFLPSESPLVSHILMSYEKHHSPSNMVIPENESQEKYVRIVRQSYGIDSSRLQPIIRHHPDGDYRVQKVDHARLNWHRIFKTEEYMRQVKMMQKQKMNSNSINSRQMKESQKQQFTGNNQIPSNFRQANTNNFTQRMQNGEKSLNGYEKSQNFLHDGNNSNSDGEFQDDTDVDRRQFTDDDENPVDADQHMIMNKTPSQDMFYKHGQNQNNMSQDVIRKEKSRDRESSKVISSGQQMHSQSMINDSQAPMPPSIDKKILQQHRNSADSEFNNKGNRKLRPATKNQILHDQPQKSQNSKMLLTECILDDQQIAHEQSNGNDHSSKSLDEIEIPGKPGQSQVPSGHRRARSSIGVARKASAKSRGENVQKLPSGGALPNTSQKTKKSSSQNRGSMLAQIRDKNSSSAMAQLQPRNAESGPKIPMHIEDEDMLDDLNQNQTTYLQNHQSQPLSVLGSDNQLHMNPSLKQRNGQSHQQMVGSSGKKSQTSTGSMSNQQQSKRQFKANPTILSGANGEQLQEMNILAEGQPNAQNAQNQDAQFMGKRNQSITSQQTAPANQGPRKKQANTINVDELQGAAQPTGNVQPNTAKIPGSVAPGGSGSFNMNHPAHSGSVRSGSLQNRQQQQQQTLGNTQLGQLGTAMGSALGTGPSNNGFVAATANIDQSSKNTINVYQFGSGVNFNLKLPGNVGASATQGGQPQNMSRKQYEQIQNALNSMNSIDRQERHNSSLEDKSFDLGMQGQVGLKNSISTQQTSQSNKQYPTMQGLTNQQNSGNFNQMIIPSTSSKRSQKLAGQGGTGSGQNSREGNTNGSGNSNRRKNNSQTQSKSNNFAGISNQYISQGQTNQQNMSTNQNDIMQMIKKREKMNNSALAQIEGGSGSRKFANERGSSNGNASATNAGSLQLGGTQNVSKIYNQKHHKTSSNNVPQGMHILDSNNQNISGSNPQQKTRRQLSNTDKTINWNNQNLNGTGGSNTGNSNSAQLQGGARKQSGGSLGTRKTSLEQKFNHGQFGANSHHRQFSDISQQNLMGYKGIGSNLGGIQGGNGKQQQEPQGVSLTSKLQQPSISEHQSMPIMSTSQNAHRFISQGGGQGQTAASGQISSGVAGGVGASTDMITQIPSFIQRQQQQNHNKFTGGVGSSGAQGNNQQQKAKAYLVNQQHQRR